MSTTACRYLEECHHSSRSEAKSVRDAYTHTIILTIAITYDDVVVFEIGGKGGKALEEMFIGNRRCNSASATGVSSAIIENDTVLD